MNTFIDVVFGSMKFFGRKYFLLVFLWFLLLSCSTNGYRQDPALTDIYGVPFDSSILFVPDSIITQGKIVPTNIKENRYLYSGILSAAKQPILFNFFVNKTNTYRFTWVPSFHLPVVICLFNRGKEYWITTTTLDRHPRYAYEVKGHWKYPLSFFPGDSGASHYKDNEFIIDSTIQPDRFALIKSTTKRKLTSQEWDKFNRMIDDSGFWVMTPSLESNGLDGAFWLLEGSKADHYWAVDRWSPQGKFKTLGDYLVALSQSKIKLY
mgnify:CR=1 FL=1